MIENPLQGIKKYSVNGVYTPGDSNSRRERAPYDFVITQVQLDKFVDAHSGTASVDLGEVILSNADGSTGPAYDNPLDRPISVYIDAETEGIVFDLSGNLTSSKMFLTAMSLAIHSGYDGGIAVHIYSRSGYSITQASMCGALALHSTGDAPVTIVSAGLAPSQGFGWSGVFRIGTCKVQGADLNLYSRPGWTESGGLTVIYEKCTEGHIVWDDMNSSPLATNLEPGAVCAPWMSPAVDSWIDTDESTWVLSNGKKHSLGLTNKVDKTLRSGGTPKLRIKTVSDGTQCLDFASQKGTVAGGDVEFVFSNGMKEALIDAGDNITVRKAVTGNIIDLGYLYLDPASNPASNNFTEQLDAILSAGGTPFVMFTCLNSTETPYDPSTDPIGATGLTYMAPLSAIGHCCYFFASPLLNGYTIRLQENTNVLFSQSSTAEDYYPYETVATTPV